MAHGIKLKGLIDKGCPVFACGADVKNRFSLFEGGRLHYSGENGDLSNPDSYARFLRSVEEMTANARIFPKLVAHDLHPMYLSSRPMHMFDGVSRMGVQHHHAHVASVMAQFELERPVIGVSFDGTGYGTDGNLWGGEFLVVSRPGFSTSADF